MSGLALKTVNDYVHAPQDRCPGCPFRGPRVGSKGDPQSPLVFVAESPGQEEVRQKEPLVGPSGRIFHQFVPEDSVYILNALECYPLPKLKTEVSMNKATGCCQDRLLRKIKMYPRRLIVAMGNPAVRSLTGDYSLKITQIRGRLIPSPLAEVGILPVVHIAALMRGGGSFRQWKQDIQYALDIGLDGREPIPYEPARVEVIPGTDYWDQQRGETTQEKVDELFHRMLGVSRSLTADIETSGFDHINDRILSVGVTPDSDTSVGYCFYPVHLPLIKKWLEDPEIKWNWHNGKFDVKFLRQAGIHARVDEDTMLLSYALDEEGGVHDLETVAADTIGAPDYKDMLKPYLPNKQASYELVPPDILARYQAIDTANTARLRPILRRRVARDEQLECLYTRTLIPASEMLAWVESNGICTDPQRIEENDEYFQRLKADVEYEIRELTGLPNLNPGSPKQVSELLFKGYKFPNRAKGSTAEDVLLKLQKETEHPVFALILKHRKAVKMYGTYVKGLRKFVHPETNRIHATYLIHGTRTGRLAARNPNMQNPPRNPQIRGTFVAAPGYELVEMDLSQAEMRSLAALSGDEILIDIFAQGKSPHKELSIFLSERGTFKPNWLERYAEWQQDPENPQLQRAKEEYTRSKNVNFGIMYGISSFGLMEQINDTRAVAQDMLDGWYERFPTAARFINQCRMTPIRNQVITTCFGRKKRVGLVSRGTLNFLQNEAANFPHQSIASDITLHTAIRIAPRLCEWGCRIVNLIHDAILMERPLDGVPREVMFPYIAKEFRQVPIDWGITAVPFISEADYGHRWGSLTTYQGDLYG